MCYKTIHFLHFFPQNRSRANHCKLAFEWKTNFEEKSLDFFVTHHKCLYGTSNPLQEKINKLTARTNQLKIQMQFKSCMQKVLYFNCRKFWERQFSVEKSYSVFR